MKAQKNNRNKWLHVRLTTSEYECIQKQFERTTGRKLSEYIRKMILGKPHIRSVRNQSTDELITELAKLKAELNAAGNNLNQAVKKLHTLSSFQQIEGWLLSWELDRKNFYNTLDTLNGQLAKISDQWSQ